MRTTLRFAEPADAAAIQALYAPFCASTTVSFESVPPTVEQMAARIGRITSRYPWLLAEVDQRLAGYVYACAHRERAAYRWAVDVAVYVDPNYQRCGVGRALYGSLFELLRQQGFYKAYAGITLPNPASVGLHEALGFVPLGTYRGVGYKFGQWRDVGWWQRELQPERGEPAEPVPIGAIRTTPAARAALAGRSLP